VTNEEIWTVVAEAYVVHFMMFGCGLAADDVFVGVEPVAGAPTVDPYAFVVARRGGARDQQFLFWIAPLPTRRDDEDFRKAWTLFSHRQPTISRADLDLLVVRSQAYQHFPELRQGLIKKGLIAESAGLDMLEAWMAMRTLSLPLEEGLTGEVPS
jgi:hypothetical protein